MMQTEREYAEAMFALSSEIGECDKYSSALADVKEVFSQNPEYIDFLASPAIPLAERCAVIDEAFGNCPEYISSFLKILCENSRIKCVCACIDEFENLVHESKNVVTAIIYSVVELDDAQKMKLKTNLEKFTQKTVNAIYKIESSLIGGIRIELDGVTYDGTVKGRLEKVKDVITG